MRYGIIVSLLAIVLLSVPISNSFSEDVRIPIWIKNNAKWWSEGEIGDSDFVKGIQYLIQEQVIQIPKSAPSGETPKIPSWVKKNAGWWAEGSIGDMEFVKGIQYLIQANIIQVVYPKAFTISSSAFENNGTIPYQFTCDGKNISPPLSIEGVPENTTSLALIVDDVDAPHGIFTHWLVWNISPDTTGFSEGEKVSFPEGKTSFGTSGYSGPCPPSGPAHRYFFKLYALDSMISLGGDSTKSDLEKSLDGHIIDQATLLGKYSR